MLVGANSSAGRGMRVSGILVVALLVVLSMPRAGAVDGIDEPPAETLFSAVPGPRLGDTRGVEAAWEPDDGGRLVVRPTARGGYAWAEIPAPPGGWDLVRRAVVEAEVANEGSDPVEPQLWVVADRGWESVGDFHRLAPGARQTFSCRLRETFPDGTPKLDPARIVAVRLILLKPVPGGRVIVSGLRGSGTAEPFLRPEGRLELPAVEDAAAAAGRRVRHRLAIDAGTAIHSILHLPDDWEGGRKDPYPVIVELPGNIFFVRGCYSPGRPEQCVIGYGMTRGRGAIWLSVPFIDRSAGTIVENGWGDPDATAEYLRLLVADVCDRFGGDPGNVVLTGFSRGAIACGYVGLRDDRVAALWKGFHCCQHHDGDGWNGATLAGAIERGKRFRGTAVFHTDNAAAAVAPVTEAMGVPAEFVQSGLGAHSSEMFLDDRESTRRLREWFRGLVER